MACGPTTSTCSASAPPPTPQDFRGEAEGLAPFGFQPSEQQPRFASLAMVLHEGALYYVSYKWGNANAHLMRYDIVPGRVTDMGPIFTEDGMGLTECHAMVVGADGKLHLVAMVWSREGQDPANPWSTRGSSYFHARLMTIDLADGPRNQDPARQ